MLTEGMSAEGMNKYGNRRVTIDGIVFDSVKEGQRWCELKLLQRAGEIMELERQVKFVLIPAQRNASGKVVERECSYIADFVYLAHDRNGWYKVVEDVKSKATKTPEYRIKKKLLLKEYGLRISEV